MAPTRRRAQNPQRVNRLRQNRLNRLRQPRVNRLLRPRQNANVDEMARRIDEAHVREAYETIADQLVLGDEFEERHNLTPEELYRRRPRLRIPLIKRLGRQGNVQRILNMNLLGRVTIDIHRLRINELPGSLEHAEPSSSASLSTAEVVQGSDLPPENHGAPANDVDPELLVPEVILKETDGTASSDSEHDQSKDAELPGGNESDSEQEPGKVAEFLGGENANDSEQEQEKASSSSGGEHLETLNTPSLNDPAGRVEYSPELFPSPDLQTTPLGNEETGTEKRKLPVSRNLLPEFEACSKAQPIPLVSEQSIQDTSLETNASEDQQESEGTEPSSNSTPVTTTTTDSITPSSADRRKSTRTPGKVEKLRSEHIEKLKADASDGLQIVYIDDEKEFGVKATKKFYEGEFVVEYKGELLDPAVGDQRYQEYDEKKGSFLFKIEAVGHYKNYWIDASESPYKDMIASKINHSKKNRNVKPNIKIIDGKPRLYFEAMRDISEGQEILYDYGERDKETLKKFPFLRE